MMLIPKSISRLGGALLCLFVLSFWIATAFGEEAESLAEAKQVAAKTGKPILIEFFRSDCEYCERSAQQAQTDANVIKAYTQVVHYHCNVKGDEGEKLSDTYSVGFTYPVFLLTNSEGDPISRWIGFSNGQRLIATLSSKLRDLTTVKERERRLAATPNISDAVNLAGYYADEMDYVKATEAYRTAQKLVSGRSDYTYQIFYQCANAVWNDSLPFSEVPPAADAALASTNVNQMNKLKVVELLSRLARKFKHTDILGPYLDQAITLCGAADSPMIKERRASFLADRALHVQGDTAQAVQLKKAGYASGWENNPQESFKFARWCLEREIDLPEAEDYCRRAATTVASKKAKAQVYSVLGEILAAQDKYNDAVDALLLSVENDPTHDSYHTQLKEYNDKLEAGE